MPVTLVETTCKTRSFLVFILWFSCVFFAVFLWFPRVFSCIFLVFFLVIVFFCVFFCGFIVVLLWFPRVFHVFFFGLIYRYVGLMIVTFNRAPLHILRVLHAIRPPPPS